MICVVLPTAHSALDLCGLHLNFCGASYRIFYNTFQPSLLTLTLVFFLLLTHARVHNAAWWFLNEMWIVGMWEPPLPHSSGRFTPHICTFYLLKAPFAIFYFSCHIQLSSGNAVQDVLILCMVNTQIGLVWGNWCEINISVNTTPPGASLWSIIYVLKRAKKLYLKINFFAFLVFFIFKGNVCIEYLCWCLW